MALVPEMLLARLAAEHAADITPMRVRPRFARRFTRIRSARRAWFLFNADRLLNRFIDYPLALRSVRGACDVFHVTDHSYAHLVHHLPAARTVVTCHDVESLQCVLEPALAPRSRPFRMMTRRIADGLRRAAVVACDSEATRREVLRHRLMPSERAPTILNGVDPAYGPAADTEADAEAARLLGPPTADAIEVLHVGSTIPRKRIDVLLRVFAAMRREVPRARLVRVSGPFSAAQARLVRELDFDGAIAVLPFVAPAVLAAIYRRAALVMIPSDLEGFGMPALEAMACGTPVLVSDMDVTREVGGAAAEYAPVADVPAWTAAALSMLRERECDPARWNGRRHGLLTHASKFSWSRYAAEYARLYRELAARSLTSPSRPIPR
jgi:glycosyltransferase involved in cell wall biosynthesis